MSKHRRPPSNVIWLYAAAVAVGICLVSTLSVVTVEGSTGVMPSPHSIYEPEIPPSSVARRPSE